MPAFDLHSTKHASGAPPHMRGKKQMCHNYLERDYFLKEDISTENNQFYQLIEGTFGPSHSTTELSRILGPRNYLYHVSHLSQMTTTSVSKKSSQNQRNTVIPKWTQIILLSCQSRRGHQTPSHLQFTPYACSAQHWAANSRPIWTQLFRRFPHLSIGFTGGRQTISIHHIGLCRSTYVMCSWALSVLIINAAHNSSTSLARSQGSLWAESKGLGALSSALHMLGHHHH